jgi:hypothetical protein
MKVTLKPSWSVAYPELTARNVYRVIAIEADRLRIMNDAGEPGLFERRAFIVIDGRLPVTWLVERDDAGRLHASPPELHAPGDFFAAYRDGDADARTRLQRHLLLRCHDEAASRPPPANRYVGLTRGDGEPGAVYRELDEEGWEIRRLEVLADGRVSYADVRGTSGATMLGDRPWQPDEATAPRAHAADIDRAAFEALWDRALADEN